MIKKDLSIEEPDQDLLDTDDMFDDECPCNDCSEKDFCDCWEAQFCCTLCHWYGYEHCEDCDPMDI